MQISPVTPEQLIRAPQAMQQYQSTLDHPVAQTLTQAAAERTFSGFGAGSRGSEAAASLTHAQITDMTKSLGLASIAQRIEPFFREQAGPMIAQFITSADRDGDGALAAREMNVTLERFAQLDRNGDGLVGADELHVSMRHHVARAVKENPHVDPAAAAQQWLESLRGDTNATVTGADTGARLAGPAPANSLQQPDPQGASTSALSELAAIAPRSADSAEGAVTTSTEIRRSLEEMAQKISDRLAEAGFTDKPPTNIRDLIDSLRLDLSSRNFLMQFLAARYPDGLGLALFG